MKDDGRPTGARSRRVLIVDDNQDSAEGLGMLLEVTGHTVSFAHDGIAAVLLAEQLRPEVMLLDIDLPLRNGYEVAKTVRAAPWGKPIVLIALTGWGDADSKHRAEQAGFNFHLTKPIDPDDLESVLGAL